MIKVRYSLIECIDVAIDYNLSREELYSALMSECDFRKVSNVEYVLAAMICKLYLNTLELQLCQLNGKKEVK